MIYAMKPQTRIIHVVEFRTDVPANKDTHPWSIFLEMPLWLEQALGRGWVRVVSTGEHWYPQAAQQLDAADRYRVESVGRFVVGVDSGGEVGRHDIAIQSDISHILDHYERVE